MNTGTDALNSSDHNYKFWQTEARAKKFRVMKGLQKPEETIFENLKFAYINPAILDLGVGAGRTTDGLLEVSRDYVGLDYSKVMCDICREKYPDVKFVVGDARDLQDFEDGSKDIVVFSYNGIDCVSPEDRIKAFNAIRRVIKSNGTFIHSSHNLNASCLDRIHNPYWLGRISISINPVSFVRQVYLYGVGIVSHNRLKKHERFGDGWAILNEQTNRFREIMYYVTPERQKIELSSSGFELIAAYGRDGKIIDDLSAAKDSWIYYVSQPIS